MYLCAMASTIHTVRNNTYLNCLCLFESENLIYQRQMCGGSLVNFAALAVGGSGDDDDFSRSKMTK